MASPVVTQFKLETTQYESKLRDATQGLREMLRMTNVAGGDFKSLSQKTKDMAASFGNIEVGAKNAKDKVRELTQAFNAVAGQYNTLTKELKESDVGRSIAGQLEVLRGRISEAKRELYDMGGQTRETGGLMDSLKDKLTLNVDAIKLFNVGLSAAKSALDVAKDAFFASEANVDEWGRVVDSSRSLYEGFLTSLNTGDISGYLSNIDSIVSAARQAYDELDRLGTLKTIQAPQMSAQQTENERMRMMIQTGRYIAPVDGRKASVKDGQLLTPEQIRRIEVQLQNGMKNVVALVGNEVKQTGKAIDAVYQRQAKELGMSLSEFRKGTSSMAEFDKRMEGYAKYQQWEATHTSEVIDTQTGGSNTIRTGGPNPYAEFAKWGTFRVDGDRYNQLVQLITQRDQRASQSYGMQMQAFRTINRAEGITVRNIMGSGRGSGTTTTTTAPEVYAEGSLKQLQQEMQALQKAQALVTSPTEWQAYQREIDQVTVRMKLLKGELPGNSMGRFEMKVDAQQLETLRNLKNVEATATYTAKVQGDNVDDIKKKLREIDGVTLGEKSLTITATDEALPKLREIEGVEIDDKHVAVTVTASTAEAIQQVEAMTRDIEGRTIAITPVVQANAPSKIGAKAERLPDVMSGWEDRGVGVSQKAVDGLVSQFQQAVQTADIGGALMQKFQTGLTDATTLSTLLKTAIEKGLNTEGMDFAGLKEQIARGIDIPEEKFQELQAKINEQLQAMGFDPISIDFKTGNLKEAKKLKEDGDSVAASWGNASKAVGSIGSALQSIEDPTAKVAGLVAQAVAQIAATFAASLKGTFTPWDWIAGAAAGTATMLTTISAIKSATKGGFAEGGIVPGNSYSGDNLRIGDYGINSGELVLTRAQTNSIAAQLTDGDGRGQGRTSSNVQISSENLRIVLHNGARARGMSVGEYLNI